ncbi:hypothetical protein VPNG_08949 [Cytospora leucostoma]|uniref:Uncharacterized protein n=1 Tax=Cytospora leucostoma TaxID=1230097 RepID=A0A423VWB6_9PEZI|nr:hypothetical protein VPNG_08949 [Cytospora leucostoma]
MFPSKLYRALRPVLTKGTMQTQIRRADAFPQYRSPYGPKYAYQPHVAGITPKTLLNVGIKSAGLGGVALFAVIFYASGIPKVQHDVLQKVPFIGSYFVNVVAPEDNPF